MRNIYIEYYTLCTLPYIIYHTIEYVYIHTYIRSKIFCCTNHTLINSKKVLVWNRKKKNYFCISLCTYIENVVYYLWYTHIFNTYTFLNNFFFIILVIIEAKTVPKSNQKLDCQFSKQRIRMLYRSKAARAAIACRYSCSLPIIYPCLCRLLHYSSKLYRTRPVCSTLQ